MSMLRHVIHERSTCGGEVRAEIFVLGFESHWNFRANLFVNDELVECLNNNGWCELVDEAAIRVVELAEELDEKARPALLAWGLTWGALATDDSFGMAA